jgi:hypothetical protein
MRNVQGMLHLQIQIYRNFGKLYASEGRYGDALKQLANDVYYSSLESGPEHIDTAVQLCQNVMIMVFKRDQYGVFEAQNLFTLTQPKQIKIIYILITFHT